MNRRVVFYTIGQLIGVEAAVMMLPLCVSLIYGEGSWKAFLITIGIAIVLSALGLLLSRPKNHVIYAKEGFATVALAWIIMSGIGALPFVISGEIPNYIDAFFETVSGFTTTGSSIVRDVEALSHGILFWRSFTHWLGGMGVLVFVMAILPSSSDRSIHLMRAEVPGPVVGKLVPKIKETAKILYLIYMVMTFIEVILLLCGGMPLFDSLVHSFGTAGTGGFGIKADSIGGYSSYCQWVITVFMLLFGINFNLFYLCLIRRFKSVLKSEELWVYLGIILAAATIITVNIMPIYNSLSQSIRLSAFQVASIITTTGYATADFNTWPVLSKGILLILMFFGACAGSTGGGFKISRVVLLLKAVKRELHRLIHPRSRTTIKFEGKNVDEGTISGVECYLALYIICFVVIFLILCFEKNFDIETNFSAATSCFNNIGPGLGAVGPVSNFADYSAVSKIVLSVAMLLGRLELFPLIITLAPSTWTKK